MKNPIKRELIHSLFATLVCFCTLLYLLFFCSDMTRFLGGWLIPRNILIIFIPIFLLGFFLIYVFGEKTSIFKYIQRIYLWTLKRADLLLTLFFLFVEIILILYYNNIYFSKGLIVKLTPDIVLGCLILISNLFLINAENPAVSRRVINSAGMILALLICFFVMLINYEIIGIDTVINAKNQMGAGVPVTEIQVLLAITTGLLVLFLFNLLDIKKVLQPTIDIIISTGLFFFALFTWKLIEIPINFLTRFIGGNQLALYADSRIYDLNGIGFYLGEGIGFGTPPAKPIYSFFLGVLHLLHGFDYQSIINSQMIFLCLIAPALYLLGKKLLNPAVGISAAILVVFRESNLITLSNQFTQSSIKMLLSESFSSLFIILLILLCIFWFTNPKSISLSLSIRGGIGYLRVNPCSITNFSSSDCYLRICH